MLQICSISRFQVSSSTLQTSVSAEKSKDEHEHNNTNKNLLLLLYSPLWLFNETFTMNPTPSPSALTVLFGLSVGGHPAHYTTTPLCKQRAVWKAARGPCMPVGVWGVLHGLHMKKGVVIFQLIWGLKRNSPRMERTSFQECGHTLCGLQFNCSLSTHGWRILILIPFLSSLNVLSSSNVGTHLISLNSYRTLGLPSWDYKSDRILYILVVYHF